MANEDFKYSSADKISPKVDIPFDEKAFAQLEAGLETPTVGDAIVIVGTGVINAIENVRGGLRFQEPPRPATKAGKARLMVLGLNLLFLS